MLKGRLAVRSVTPICGRSCKELSRNETAVVLSNVHNQDQMIYGRRPRQLIVVWGILMALILLIRWFETSAPAFHEMVQPFYWILFAVGFFLTWRWLRARSR